MCRLARRTRLGLGRGSERLAAPDRTSRTDGASSRYAELAAETPRGRADRLEQEVAQEEAEVEGRVAGVGAFEVEQDEAAGVHQDVLGAEVAEDQRALVVRPIHRGDQRIDARGQVRMRRATVR